MVFVGDTGLDPDEHRRLIEDNDSLAYTPPRSNRTSHRWCDSVVYRKQHVVENIFQRISIEPLGDSPQKSYFNFPRFRRKGLLNGLHTAKIIDNREEDVTLSSNTAVSYCFCL
jgi:hypothetical protein